MAVCDTVGLPLGRNHCVIAAVRIILHAFTDFHDSSSPWQFQNAALATGVKRARHISRNARWVSPFVIVTNDSCGLLPDAPRGYSLASFVAMDEMDLGSNTYVAHFSTFALSSPGNPSGYFVYDDVLNLAPGEYQGGFVPANAAVHDMVLAQSKERVAVSLFVNMDRMSV